MGMIRGFLLFWPEGARWGSVGERKVEKEGRVWWRVNRVVGCRFDGE